MTRTTRSVVMPVEAVECARLLVQELTPDQGQTAPRAFGLAVALQSMLAAAPAPTGAKAVIRNGQVVISIDVDALPLILSGSIALNAVAGTFKVTDAAAFAKEVCLALNNEKEDGTTRVHMMFDSAFNHAIDQGCEGVEEISEDDFEAEANRLQKEAEELREALIQADLKIRSFPGADQSDVEFIRAVLKEGDAA